MTDTFEFNLERYREILVKAIDKGFSFQTFSDYLARPASKVVLLRHDVDVSIEWALSWPRSSVVLAFDRHFS